MTLIFVFTPSVLIDTWWNVNALRGQINNYGFGVLIDTWWNVNLKTLKVAPLLTGFNRYMVECEFKKPLGSGSQVGTF